MFEDFVKQVHAIRYNDCHIEEIDDPVVVEETVTFYFNGRKYLSLVATNDSLTELGAGFFIAAGIAKKIEKVDVRDLDIWVKGEMKATIIGCMESAGGFSPDRAELDADIKTSIITPDEIFTIKESLNGDTWAKTGGLHCTALSHQHQIVAIFSDIGRHNTIDKAIGYMTLHGFNPQECVLGCTGRQPIGMVKKAVNAGIPIIVSRAATTTAGIELAQRCGITLICFTRDRRFTTYTHPERVRFS